MADKYADRPHPSGTSLRAKLSTADLSAWIQQIPGKGQADYVPHGVIRALLIKSGLDYDWTVDTFVVEGGWQARGELTIRWDDGTTQRFCEISDIEQGPATASSRLFVRCVAFATGLGLQAWEPKALKLMGGGQ